jgi:hypothetical protein
MVTLRLKVAYRAGESGSSMAVTSNMLDVEPSVRGVCHPPSAHLTQRDYGFRMKADATAADT